MGKLENFFSNKRTGKPEDTPESVAVGRAAKRSYAYKRHFEGYSEKTEVDSDGRKSRYRVYEGTLYTPEITRKRQIVYKIIYLLIWLACAAILVFCAIQRTPANVLWYGAVSLALVTAGLLWNMIGMINYLIVPFQRTVGEWRSSTRHLLKSTIITAGASFVTLIVNIITCIYFESFSLGQFICIGGFTIGTILMLIWYMLEKNINYLQKKNQNK